MTEFLTAILRNLAVSGDDWAFWLIIGLLASVIIVRLAASVVRQFRDDDR